MAAIFIKFNLKVVSGLSAIPIALAVLFGLYFLWPLFQSDDSTVTTEPLVLKWEKWEISVVKPKARNAQELPKVEGKEATTVTVTRSQEIYVNDQPVAPGDLLDELTTRVALAPEKPLFVKSDVAAPYGLIVSIVNDAREAGVERIGLLVNREQPRGKGIFMVIQPTTQYDLRARVPGKPTEDLPENVVVPSDAIVVAVSLDGEISINQDPVSLNQLGTRLFDIYSAHANKNLFVQAHGQLPFGTVIRVIDLAKGAGVGDIGLMTLTP